MFEAVIGPDKILTARWRSIVAFTWVRRRP